MSANPESFDTALADLCEFVDFNRQCIDSPIVMRCAVASELEGVARRLKVAHKREVEDAERRGHHAATKACCETIAKAGPFYDAESVGNSAKLREAAKYVQSTMERLRDPTDKNNAEFIRVWEIVSAALAAPARNCDIGTVKEQRDRFGEFCRKEKLGSFEASGYCAHDCPCGNNYDCKLAWARLPFKSEAAR